MGWVLPGERDWSRVTREEVSRTMYLVSCVLEFLAPGASFDVVKLKGGVGCVQVGVAGGTRRECHLASPDAPLRG